MDLCVRDAKTKKIVGYEKVPCHSFLKGWMTVMRAMMAHDDVNIPNAYDAYEYEIENQYNSNLRLLIGNNYNYFCGPVIGTGTTAPAPTDTRMEQQITHGDVAPNGSVLTGTTHASSGNEHTVYDDGGNPFSNDQYNHYILEMTSGPDNGQERIILDTVDSSPDYLGLSRSTSYSYGIYAPLSAEQKSQTYKIKTYGMMNHGLNAITAPEDDGSLTSTMTITRTFANGCGTTINVSEFGCIFIFDNPAHSQYYTWLLGIRDTKVTPVAVANGQELTLTYTLACEA